jgi:hypothetical protein
VLRRIGWLALLLAASGWFFLWFAISRANIFCGGGPDDCPSLLGEAPRYVAVFGMLAPAIAISLILDRRRDGPRFMSFSAIVLSSLGLASALAMTVAAYDQMRSSIGSGQLDAPYREPVLPAVLQRLGALWPLFIGGWMTLASVQLVRLGIPLAIAGLGVVAGFAVVLTLPFAAEWFVYTSVFPLELTCSLVWATMVGVYLLTSPDDRRAIFAPLPNRSA